MTMPSLNGVSLHLPIVTAVLIVAAAACSQRDPLLDAPPSFGTLAAPSVLPAGPGGASSSAVAVLALAFSPPALNGGESTTATVTLTVPAPTGGYVLHLSSDDPSAAPPPSIVLAAGETVARFPVATSPVANDRNVRVTASDAHGSVSSNLAVWSILPMFLAWVETNGVTGESSFTRITPVPAQFFGWCQENEVSIQASNVPGIAAATVRFAAPEGTPLTTGVYDDVPGIAFRPPATAGLDVALWSFSTCSGTRRFEVREADFGADGTIHRFWATFEHSCPQFNRHVRGEVRANTPMRFFSDGNCLQ